MEEDDFAAETRESLRYDLKRLLSAQQGITSEKITERKKNATLLLELLDMRHVLEHLNKNSSVNGRESSSRGKANRTSGSGITWKLLFLSVKTYVAKEIDAVQKLEEKGSSTVGSKKKDILALVVGYIRASNKRGSYLPLVEVLDFMRAMMANKKTRSWSVSDHTHILLSHILPVPQYCISISSSKWKDLLDLYCGLYDEVSGEQKALMARAVSSLLLHCSPQADISLNKLYIFYMNALKNISEEKDCKLLEELLSGLCKYCSVAGPNGRSRICSLGEDIMLSVLHMRARGLPTLKSKITEFLRIQIRVHHPDGRILEDDGAWFRDEDQWRSCIRIMYEQVIDEYSSGANTTSRLRRSSSLVETNMVQEFPYLDLSCDVIYLYLHMLEGHKSASSITGTPRAKKRKYVSCWESLREGLRSSKDAVSTSSWLQLITWLLCKWDDSLPSFEFLPLLSLLQSFLREKETKRSDSVKCLLLCLYALALNCTKSLKHSREAVQHSARECWSEVWKSTIKMLAVHCCAGECYLLLTALLKHRLVEPRLPGPWQLMHSSLQQPTKTSVAFLVCFLGTHNSLPHAASGVGGVLASASGLSGGTLVASDGEGVASLEYPLRSQLLHYLMPVSRPDSHGCGLGGLEALGICKTDSTGSMRMEQGTSSYVMLMSHALVGLTQRSHGSAKLPFLTDFYQSSSASAFFREVFDPSFAPSHRTRFNRSPFSSQQSPSSKGDLIGLWKETEKIYLQSTFDEPLFMTWCDNSGTTASASQFSSETTMDCLRALLLQLLHARSNFLLQNWEAELSSSARERAQQVGHVCEQQALHCSIIIHVVLLLCVCEAFTHPDQLRKTPAIKSVPLLLKSIETSLRDHFWSEMEHVHYFKACGLRRKLLMVRKLCSLSLPDSLQQLIFDLSMGKRPAAGNSQMSSTFSMAGSSASTFKLRTERRSTSVGFDEEDLLSDSMGSSHSDSSSTSGMGPQSMLSLSCLSDKSYSRLCCAVFLAQLFINHSLIQPAEVEAYGEAMGGLEGAALANFDINSALSKCLSEQDKSRPVNLQMAYKIIEMICLQLDVVKNNVMDNMVEVIGEVLSIHKKNQIVYGETLSLLALLLPHLNKESEELTNTRATFMTLASGFWKLYEDSLLPAEVRLKLVDFMGSVYAADRKGSWAFLEQRRARVAPLSVHQALVKMVNDEDHAVRMRIGEVIISLYISKCPGLDDVLTPTMSLVHQKMQQEIFAQVMESLQLAYFIPDGLHDLSSEDESVNRVSSRVYTLQLMACVSPLCERKVVSELVLAVKLGHIETDLVEKSLGQVAQYLGYKGIRELLESMLLSLVQDLHSKNFTIIDFPYSLMGYPSAHSFLEVYSCQLLPYFVFHVDEPSVVVIAETLTQDVTSLLKDCLPTCMVLILSCYALEERKEQEQCTRSHDLLQKHLSKEVIGQILQQRMDQFVLQLLLRMFEPHTEDRSHLAQFTLPSDPQPPPPSYSSRVVRATLDYMPKCYVTSVANMSLLRLLSKRNDHIQNILLSLAVKIVTNHRSFEKRRLLVAYNLFVQLISKELKAGGLEAIRSFVVMDVIFTVIRIISNSKKKMAKDIILPSPRELLIVCLDILQNLCLAVLEGCQHELAPHLHTLVANVMPIAKQSHTSQGKKALSFLSQVLAKLSSEDLSKLDPFPSFDCFSYLKQKQLDASQEIDLRDKIEIFLARKTKLLDSTNEELESLRNCLQGSQFEAELLLKQGSNNLILKFLCTLIEEKPSVLSSEMASSIGRVLGEVGPRDMECIALPSARNQSLFDPGRFTGEWDDTAIQYVEILHHLSTLLQDKDIEIVQASSQCLKEILRGKTMPGILSNLEREDDTELLHWVRYLHPFKPSKRKRASSVCSPPPPNLTSFSSLVDLNDLWLPSTSSFQNNGTSHAEWLTKLVVAMLDSSGVTDEVLIAVKGVCKIKTFQVHEVCYQIYGPIEVGWIVNCYDQFEKLTLKMVELCEDLFPLIIHNVLLASNKDNNFAAIISRHVKQFFRCVSTESRSLSPSLTPSQSSKSLQVSSDSVKTMLNMVLYLRTMSKCLADRRKAGEESTPWENNFWLDLDFLDVARAAQKCSAYFTSLLYVEIWKGARDEDPTRRRTIDLDSENGEEVIVAESVVRRTPMDETSELQCLLLEAYRHIGEPDSLYGACSSFTNTSNKSFVGSHSTRLSLYEHEGDWQRALSTYNNLMELPSATGYINIAESLHQLGLSHVLKMYLRGVMGESEPESYKDEQVSEYLYERAWRCSQWTTGSPAEGVVTESRGYHQSVYSCLTSLRDGEMKSLQESLEEARHMVVKTLLSTSLESTYSLYPFLSKLLCLLEIEEAGAARASLPADYSQPDHSQPPLQILNFLNDWEKRYPHMNSDFQFIEPVLAVRASLLHCLLEVGKKYEVESSNGSQNWISGANKALKDVLFNLSRSARDAANYQVCERALFSLRMIQQSQQSSAMGSSSMTSLDHTGHSIAMEETKLHWKRGDKTYAMALMSKLLDTLKNIDDKTALYPACLNLYGNWLAETHSESPAVIMSNYLERSVSLIEEDHMRDTQSVMEAYLGLARFADSQYRRIVRHMVSSVFEAKEDLLRKSKRELQNLESAMAFEERQRDRHVRTLQKQSKEDELGVANLLEEKQMFLKKALKNYILCLQTGEAHDLRIFQLCGLWFANAGDTSVNKIIKEGITRLPSYKFVPLMYQLAARISSSMAEESFQQALQEVILKCTLEHPYHCLYVILALGNASKDNRYPRTGYVTGTLGSASSTSRLHRKATSNSSVDEDKVKAAKAIIAKLRKKKGPLVQSMEQLSEAYIDVAYYDVSAHKTVRTGIKFPSTCPLLRLSKGQVAIPTLDLDIDKSCDYRNITFLESFDGCFQLAGGVNLPKIVTCIGSDGKRRKQLIKGKDDLRQDAVMQQIFMLVNHLLKLEPDTRKRKLRIRTYKVIPLSQRSGIVEWCEGTCPLGEYLIGNMKQPKLGAHHRYRPGDWMSLRCRKRMLNIPSGSSKYLTYREITKQFQPVFHHFFMEHFPAPPQWFERRLCYTRSVAASSIVGYMVGLGDRHVQNILIDTNTAELVHIDLGVAFEQGKTLPTPETVPFRLTRDLVDGMGMAGVEGVFRQCCEKTMSLLRVHQEELRTIVEVLLHDPLYQWTLSPLKALNLQRRPDHEDTSIAGDMFDTVNATTNKGQDSDLNKMAERVLIRLQEKLEGIEDGVPLSVSGQVNHLIQEATDPNNLCRLFAGWQSWI